MEKEKTAGAQLRYTLLVGVLAALIAALAPTLVWALMRGYFTEWATVQQRYNVLASHASLASTPIGIKQIWQPEIGIVDRCSSCHLGVEAANPMLGESLFAPHPPIPHDPRTMGCTPCHGGQGRATTASAAHGNVEAWADPLLEPAYVEAGCGSCHSHILVPNRLMAAAGQHLYEEQRCGACHTGERELATIGLRGIPESWHTEHMGRVIGEEAFAPLAEEEIPLVNAYLQTLIGAPRLMAGKMLAQELGCRGCHRINGVGGEEGPDLSNVGRAAVEDMDFSRIRGPHTRVAWIFEHFRAPGTVVRGSRMPRVGASDDERRALTLYALSLRAREMPLERSPLDRVRGLRLRERDFATDGPTVFAAFCSACHGARGEGASLPGARAPVPAIGGTEFLAIADDELLRQTIRLGRPGRRMAAWGSADWGLRAPEIDAVVAHLRSLQPVPPEFDAVMAEPVDIALGMRVFADRCATCHGPAGAGTGLAPPLSAADNQVTVNDNAIYGTLATGVAGTAMGSFRDLDAPTVRAVIAAVRALPRTPAPRAEWRVVAGNGERGRPLFAQHCSTCHGRYGEGVEAPALRNAGLLGVAGDGFLIATIVRGRAPAKMPRFGAPGPDNAQLTAIEVADIVAFVRRWAPQSR